MNPGSWLQGALDELIELAPDAKADPSDAWRAVTLLARVLGSPTGVVPPPAIVQMLPALLEIAGLPEPEDVLAAVDKALASDLDPWGPLIDGLLDADDAVGGLVLGGQDHAARELSARVAGLVSLYPERTIPLGGFAQMRLETVRSDAIVAEIWRAVERAPARALADALPRRMQVAPVPVIPEPRRTPGAIVSFPVPAELQLAAADSAMDAASVELGTEDPALKAWVYSEAGQMRLEIKGLRSPASSAALIATRRGDGAELARADFDVQSEGSTVYASLGPWAGPDNLLHRLVAKSGLAPEELRLWITVADE